MKLVEVETIGVRGLADATFAMGDGVAPAPLVVVTGPPGAGATTLLEAIAFAAGKIGSVGPMPDPAQVLRVGGAVAAVRSAWWVDDDERRYGGLIEEVTRAQVNFERGGIAKADADPGLLGLMSRYDHTREVSKVVLFPARRVAEDAAPSISDFEASQRIMRLAPATSKYAGLQRALASARGQGAAWETAERLMNALSPSAKLAGVNGVGQLEFTSAAGAKVPLFRLSFSERNAFVFAASVALMGLERSVLLVDTPELGLPVGLAARWVSALRERTPDAQWIVASRDPELVALAGKGGVVDLGRRSR